MPQRRPPAKTAAFAGCAGRGRVRPILVPGGAEAALPMELTGERRIEAPRETVWRALNDPEVLKAAIPGCQALEKTGDNAFAATVQAKVGPVKATFAGAVELTDITAPERYRISGGGAGGAAGFARGGAWVRLAEDGDATLLTYEADAQVGGKLAQIGSRLIQGAARKLAGQFFDRFAAAVQQDGAEDDPPAAGG